MEQPPHQPTPEQQMPEQQPLPQFAPPYPYTYTPLMPYYGPQIYAPHMPPIPPLPPPEPEPEPELPLVLRVLKWYDERDSFIKLATGCLPLIAVFALCAVLQAAFHPHLTTSAQPPTHKNNPLHHIIPVQVPDDPTAPVWTPQATAQPSPTVAPSPSVVPTSTPELATTPTVPRSTPTTTGNEPTGTPPESGATSTPVP